MKVSVEDISTVKKVMHVEVPKKEVGRELDKAYKTLKNNVKIKGFRPGKVPLSLLEKKFHKEIHSEVSGQLIQNTYKDALDEAKLRPVGEPDLDRPDLEKGKSYKYSATLEVRPPINDIEINGLSLEEKVYAVDDEEVETQIKVLQKRNAQLKTVEDNRPAKENDVVIIDYEGFKDGEPSDTATKTENFQVELGSGRILDDFDSQIVGMKIDTMKDIEVHFPEDYYNENLADMDMTFKVTLKEIKEEILPELDDEFAKDLGEYETFSDLEKAIREHLDSQYKGRSQQFLKKDIMDALIEQADFEVPEGLVEEELAGIVRDAQALMTRKGISMEDAGETEDGLSEKYRPLAERKVKEYLILEKVIEQEEITLSDEVLDEAYQKFADTLGESVDAIKEFHNSDPDANEIFKQRALEKQVIKHIIENSKVEQVEGKKGEKEEEESDAD